MSAKGVSWEAGNQPVEADCMLSGCKIGCKILLLFIVIVVEIALVRSIEIAAGK